MTETQKNKIRQMRLDGCGYRHIAAKLELSLSAVKSYCRCHRLTGFGKVVALNNAVRIEQGLICMGCGKRLRQTPGKKKKIFCSDKCRKKYRRSRGTEND